VKKVGLNKLGLEGWELVAVVPDGDTFVYYFKRELDTTP
jgi:hypothetical protein